MVEKVESGIDILGAMRGVFDTEIHGLSLMYDHIGEEFIRAVELILNTKGKVITGGVGKSGHIAAKMAATLSSIGVPSFFIHSNEASHGDLGAISDNDCLILLSNSGNTAELSDIIYYTQRFGIPMIAITSNTESLLSKNATITLSLPPGYEEASNLDAPTTSSTMMMVLGDALSVTLQKITGFSQKDFGMVHPGGKLGAQLKTVTEFMHTGDDLPLVKANASIQEIVEIINRNKLGCTCVVDEDNKLVGIITDGDLRRSIGADMLALKASDIMTNNPQTIAQESFLSLGLKTMDDNRIMSLVVVDHDNIVVGILHLHSCIQAGVV